MSDYLSRSKAYKGYHFSVLSQEMLDYLHQRGKEMLQCIVSIFSQNDIRYFCCGGTLLGAATTGKFIPWDDDIDLCILETDYDKALQLLEKELPDTMVLQWKSSEPKYFHGWAKIRDKKSHVKPDIPTYKYNGIWADLYPVKKCKSNETDYLIKKEHRDYLERRLKANGITPEEFTKRVNESKLTEEDLQNELNHIKQDESKTVYMICSASKIVLDEDWVKEKKNDSTLSFEGMKVYTFCNYEKYLERHYGSNYMILPPDEKRRVGINRVDIIK